MLVPSRSARSLLGDDVHADQLEDREFALSGRLVGAHVVGLQLGCRAVDSGVTTRVANIEENRAPLAVVVGFV